ncbi:ras-related protein RABE1c-like isoform X2 [Phoenix dactylifera]|uniref:Ras-related protein RABE1c-like isoform X2 n=1 Tax=Phoenix dactylifera TaxID=42345 RepID=A0A8B8J0W8_PHODC|nr:ras-related protein RABE1c-like isoform X2 [Phoenix dactylifera]
MAAPPARARADYDYLIKLLLIGDSGLILRSGQLSLMGNVLSCRFGIQLVKNVSVQLQQLITGEQWVFCWFMMSPTNLLSTTLDIRNWIRQIEQHASDNVNKILVGNKADMDENKRAVSTSQGQMLADEYGIKFFETSAKTNFNVEQVFFSIARDIKQRLAESDSKSEPQTIKISKPDAAAAPSIAEQKSSCCGS